MDSGWAIGDGYYAGLQEKPAWLAGVNSVETANAAPAVAEH